MIGSSTFVRRFVAECELVNENLMKIDNCELIIASEGGL